MTNSRRELVRVIVWMVGGVVLLLSTGCGKVFIRAPAEDQTSISTPFTLQAQKNGNAFCRFRSNTFRAFLDKGQSGETDITNAFSRPASSNIWSAENYSLPAGQHTFYVEGRFAGSFCYDKFDSDVQELNITVPPLPDLTIASLDIVPNSPSTSDLTTAEIVVDNQGGAASGPTVASVSRDGVAIDTVDVPAINAGASTTVSQNLSFPAAGTYALDVVVDPNDIIPEISNANNASTTTVTVRDCSGNDRVAALNAARERIARGDVSIDLDGDCLDEYTRSYGTGGDLIREEIDADGNGVAEMVWDHSSSIRTVTLDEDGDGVAEYSEQAFVDSGNSNVFHVTVTEDTSDDGIPDYRIEYSVDANSNDIELQHSKDEDQDGNFTSTHKSTSSREQFYGGVSIEEAGAWACSSQQAQQISDAYDQMLAEGWSCLNGMSPQLALDFLLTQARSTIKVSCLPDPTPCGAVDTYRAKWRWLFGFDELPILLGQGNFDGSGTCRPLKHVLFHELLHYVVGLHRYGNGLDDPGDSVFGCVDTCFGDVLGNPGNSITCAACLGKTNGTSRCGAYPPAACPSDVPTYCRCNEEIYQNEATCGGACPVNLGCFVGQCQTLGPCR